ncbi:FMN-linked oxidoreductase [Zopfia rhizophila CBS 207.26]|uniref:FMN-linked oxidoreductase n=1 Tax=Zopfia rhizophila CBS 207.26 TaxID=1314779 RepID=A0A6A6DZ85_9PEZI|nr:FMN-linked oxidoreductase [Zopfia rhizophila CBS 207.26]
MTPPFITAFYRHRIIPSMLVNTNERDTCTSILGHRVPAPIGFAPIGINKLYHPMGELPLPNAAGSTSIEDVGRANGEGLRFFQLCMPHDDELTVSLLERAMDSGFKACILTPGTWQLAWRHDDVAHSNYAFYHGIGADLGLINPVFQKRLGKGSGGMPLCLKGIQSVEDAAKAVEIGCDGIVVSNHAGRQGDGAVASLDALEKIVDALALGAKFVFVGRLCVLADFDILLNVAKYKSMFEIDRTALDSSNKIYTLLPENPKL